MDYQKRNLQSLVAEFRDKGKALNGFKTINSYLQKKDSTALADLLRFHDPKPVYEAELLKRFEIDTLVEFYNLLVIAALSGYVPAQLSESLQLEIKTVLGHKSVMPYYVTYYPYKTTEYTLAYVQNQDWFSEVSVAGTEYLFNEFAALSRSLKKDKDIELFTGMLDFVSYGDHAINKVKKALLSYDKLHKSFTAADKSETDMAVWGFIKYTVFISQLKELILLAGNFPLLQSAMWLYHGYYLDRMNKEMNTFFAEAFENIGKILAEPATFEQIAEELYGEEVPDDFDPGELKQFAFNAVEQSKQDVMFILNPEWGNAMKQHFNF